MNRRNHRPPSITVRAVAAAALVTVIAVSSLAAMPASAASSHPGASPSGVVLQQGDRSDAVRALQSALIRNGIAVYGGADGVFGPKTAEAVADYQQRNGLPSTGVVDTVTAQLLGLTASPDLPARGQRGDAVRALQQALVDAGIEVRGGVDGVFGSGTAAAVEAFQRAKELPATGVVDIRTALALGLLDGSTPDPGPSTPAPSLTLEEFPMQGLCAFGDTFGAPRSGGRTHEGVDIIADAGKLIYAVTDGTITKLVYDVPGSRGGNNLRLTMDDGSNTYFYYAHLSGFADGIKVGSKVQAGQILGTNGETGNAPIPHLHLEVHPGGGGPVNPYRYVKAVDSCDVTEALPQP